MSGRWVSTGGKGRVWVNEGQQLFAVTYHAFITATDAGEAVGIAQEMWTQPGEGWTATPVPLPAPDQPELPQAMTERVHTRVQSDLADSEFAQVEPLNRPE